MTDGDQTSIEVPTAAAGRGPCAWCERPGVHDLEVVPARYTAKGGVRRIAKRATVVPVCDEHFNSLERSDDAA